MEPIQDHPVQKAIESLFRRPVRGQPAPLNPEQLKFVDTDNHRWGLKNLAGVAVSPRPEVHLFLEAEPIPGFQESLQELFPESRLHFEVTGPIHFLVGPVRVFTAGVGSNISLHDVPAIGRIALFLNDNDTPAQRYALTCAHVLDGDPTKAPQVDSGGQRIGTLTQLVDLSFGGTSGAGVAPNQVDCALARLDAGVAPSNALPPTSGNIVGFDSAQQNATVTMVNSSSTKASGIVSSTHANCRVFDPIRGEFAHFEGLLTITGSAGIGAGDSGTVVLSADNRAVGMVIAKSLISGHVMACDISTVKIALEAKLSQTAGPTTLTRTLSLL